MRKFMAIIYLASISIVGAQAFANTQGGTRVRSTPTEPSYYCGILKAYGQVDPKNCGPYQLQKKR